ncbi:hypothetical protein [Terribacillus sp. JSM ZJ617]|uniref:hypothetical protein n=1 Tax=Terribacillus sp. JSM ZJ617 TaxID=3342119 RepID=UPI0035A901AA
MLTDIFAIVLGTLVTLLISLIVLRGTKNITIGILTCIVVGIIVPALFGFFSAFIALPISLILFFVFKGRVI